MKRHFVFILVAVLSFAACQKFEIPVIGEYEVLEVEIGELSGLCLNKDNSALLACGDKGVIKSISFDGQVEEIWSGTADLEGIAIHPTRGDIYLAIEGAQEVHKIPYPGYTDKSLAFIVRDAVDGYYGNSGLEGIAHYKNDIFFVGSQKLANLWQYRSNGTLLSTVSLSSFAAEVAGLSYDKDAGWLWVADSKLKKIFVCEPDGTLVSTYEIPFVENAESICVDRERGCVWVGSDESPTKLYKFYFDL